MVKSGSKQLEVSTDLDCHIVHRMLGVLHSAASDFSTFCYPRSPYSSVICNEVHESSIEERYCPKQHVHLCDDQEWEELLACGVQLFDESEADSVFMPEPAINDGYSNIGSDIVEPTEKQEDEEIWVLPEAPPSTPVSTQSTPSLIGDNGPEDSLSSFEADSGSESDYETETGKASKKSVSLIRVPTSKNKRKRGKGSRASNPRKHLCRSESSNSVSTISSIASTSSNTSSSTALFLQSMMNSDNPWKCPHCSWIQHTQRLPDFLRHQRSHFVSQSDWPCPNPKCGKGFARKDSLKRHLDNKATGCKRPPGYTVC